MSSGSKVSSKRVVTLLSFVLMGIGFLSNLFFDFKIDQQLFTSMEYIVIAGLGFTASEGFTKKKEKKNEGVEDNA
jgi:hypothetical protein